MSGEGERGEREGKLVLVARKGCFGLPTACPFCLPAYCYLRFAGVDFKLEVDRSNPDSDHIPYVEYWDFVGFNNEKGGVIEWLNEKNIVQLDSQLSRECFPDYLATKVLINSWLVDAVQYELWVSSDRSIAHEIYFSDLPWPIGRILQWKQTAVVKQFFGISKENIEEKEKEIYRKATLAYDALSRKLDENNFFFDERPTSVDALFLGHAVFVLHVLPDTSMLKTNFLNHANLVKFAEAFKMLEASSSSAPGSEFPFDVASSNIPSPRTSNWSSKPREKEKKPRTEEEKAFRRRSKYFLAAQAVAIVIFLSLLGGDASAIEDDDEH